MPANKLNFLQKTVNWLIKVILHIVCRLHTEQLNKIPMQGPLLAVGNHINFLEVPIMATHLMPRPMVGLAKVESWENPIKGFLFDMWGGIPVKRGEVDRTALNLVLEALNAGKIVGIAPEGTRSHHGGLQEGRPGIVLMALRSGAPVLPVVLYGHENFWQNLKRLKRTDVYIEVGRPFRFVDHGEALSRDVREEMTREVMYQMAALLPPLNRGIYADLDKATCQYVQFVEL